MYNVLIIDIMKVRYGGTVTWELPDANGSTKLGLAVAARAGANDTGKMSPLALHHIDPAPWSILSKGQLRRHGVKGKLSGGGGGKQFHGSNSPRGKKIIITSQTEKVVKVDWSVWSISDWEVYSVSIALQTTGLFRVKYWPTL